MCAVQRIGVIPGTPRSLSTNSVRLWRRLPKNNSCSSCTCSSPRAQRRAPRSAVKRCKAQPSRQRQGLNSDQQGALVRNLSSPSLGQRPAVTPPGYTACPVFQRQRLAASCHILLEQRHPEGAVATQFRISELAFAKPGTNPRHQPDVQALCAEIQRRKRCSNTRSAAQQEIAVLGLYGFTQPQKVVPVIVGRQRIVAGLPSPDSCYVNVAMSDSAGNTRRVPRRGFRAFWHDAAPVMGTDCRATQDGSE